MVQWMNCSGFINKNVQIGRLCSIFAVVDATANPLFDMSGQWSRKNHYYLTTRGLLTIDLGCKKEIVDFSLDFWWKIVIFTSDNSGTDHEIPHCRYTNACDHACGHDDNDNDWHHTVQLTRQTWNNDINFYDPSHMPGRVFFICVYRERLRDRPNDALATCCTARCQILQRVIFGR